MQVDYWDSTIILGEPAAPGIDAAAPDEREDADLSRRVTAALLLPQGRPGGWLVFLVALCGWVIVEAVRLRLLAG